MQFDQMVRLFFKIWPFATKKTSPIMSQICQSRVSILPNKKWTVKKLPKTCKFLPKWIWSVTLVQANYICRYILLLLLGCVDAKNLFFHRRLVPIVNFVFNSLQLIYERHSGLAGMTIVRRLQKLGRKSIEIGRYISAWLLSRRIKYLVLVNLYKKMVTFKFTPKIGKFHVFVRRKLWGFSSPLFRMFHS